MKKQVKKEIKLDADEEIIKRDTDVFKLSIKKAMRLASELNNSEIQFTPYGTPCIKGVMIPTILYRLTVLGSIKKVLEDPIFRNLKKKHIKDALYFAQCVIDQ